MNYKEQSIAYAADKMSLVLYATTSQNLLEKQIQPTLLLRVQVPYFIKYSVHTFYIENDAEVFLAHYAWKVVEKGFKMAFMMNKLAIIKSCEIILEK